MRMRTAILAGVLAVVTAALAAQAQVPGVNSTLNSVFTLAYDNSTMKPTYSATIAGLAAPNGGGDICSLYGSSTKTLKVRRVLVGGFGAALMTDPISVVKRSTVSSGGTATQPSAIPYDSSNGAATASKIEAFTAVPTAGTLVGVLADVYITIAGATTSVAAAPTTEIRFGQLGQPIVLRGTAQSINVNTTGLGAFTATCTFEWTEE